MEEEFISGHDTKPYNVSTEMIFIFRRQWMEIESLMLLRLG